MITESMKKSHDGLASAKMKSRRKLSSKTSSAKNRARQVGGQHKKLQKKQGCLRRRNAACSVPHARRMMHSQHAQVLRMGKRALASFFVAVIEGGSVLTADTDATGAAIVRPKRTQRVTQGVEMKTQPQINLYRKYMYVKVLHDLRNAQDRMCAGAPEFQFDVRGEGGEVRPTVHPIRSSRE